jgi:hypothetical protein
MCETMQSSHRLCPTMTLVRTLLSPTESDDGPGVRFCASLTPSTHFSKACPEKTFQVFVTCYFCYMFSLGPSSGSTGSIRIYRSVCERYTPNIYRCIPT